MPPAPNPFRGLANRADVARLLGTSPAQLLFLLHVRNESERYSEFCIPKRRGGVRRIFAPRPDLKRLQTKLSEAIVSVYRPPSTVHGFISERSIVTNAKDHTGCRFVLNIDLRDFFPTINFGRVLGLFMSTAFGARRRAAIVLAQICCHEKSLPAGAPTSPIIANMICWKLDRKLLELAKSHRCRYSRYVDDITFSKRQHSFPSEIAYIGESQGAVAGKELREAVESNGFEIHTDKVKLFRNTYRQEVTGLVVNNKVNVQRRFVRQLRAMLNAWKKYGTAKAEQEYLSFYWNGSSESTDPPRFSEVVRGKIEFVKMVRGIGDPVYRKLQSMLVEVLPEYFSVLERENCQMKLRDVFISHASEDKDEFVRPLTEALLKVGISVWYDEYAILLGDSILEKIDEGLAHSRFGVVILSPSFFAAKKTWTRRELDGLVAAEDVSKQKRILPIWHKLTHEEVFKRSPTLAGRMAAVSATQSLDDIVEKIRLVVQVKT